MMKISKQYFITGLLLIATTKLGKSNNCSSLLIILDGSLDI